MRATHKAMTVVAAAVSVAVFLFASANGLLPFSILPGATQFTYKGHQWEYELTPQETNDQFVTTWQATGGVCHTDVGYKNKADTDVFTFTTYAQSGCENDPIGASTNAEFVLSDVNLNAVDYITLLSTTTLHSSHNTGTRGDSIATLGIYLDVDGTLQPLLDTSANNQQIDLGDITVIRNGDRFTLNVGTNSKSITAQGSQIFLVIGISASSGRPGQVNDVVQTQTAQATFHLEDVQVQMTCPPPPAMQCGLFEKLETTYDANQCPITQCVRDDDMLSLVVILLLGIAATAGGLIYAWRRG